MSEFRRLRSLALASVLALLVAVTLAACGGSPTVDTVTDDVVETQTDVVPEDTEPQPGDEVMTEEKVPGGGKAKEKETVAPKKDQGDCAAGEVEAGGECIPDQASG